MLFLNAYVNICFFRNDVNAFGSTIGNLLSIWRDPKFSWCMLKMQVTNWTTSSNIFIVIYSIILIFRCMTTFGTWSNLKLCSVKMSFIWIMGDVLLKSIILYQIVLHCFSMSNLFIQQCWFESILLLTLVWWKGHWCCHI